MMKNLNALYSEVIASDALKAEFLALKTPEDIVAFAKKHGCDVTLDDIKAFFEKKQKEAGELSEAELEQVAGGKSVQGQEAALSCISFGLVCVVITTASLIRGSVGTGIEGKGMLCALRGKKDSPFER